MKTFFFFSVLCLVLAQFSTAYAQPPGVTPNILLDTSVSGEAEKHAVVLIVEFAPGSTTGRHTHPGDEYATVIEGELEILTDGNPPLRVQAGRAYHNTRDVVHETKNPGTLPAKIITTLVAATGKPLSIPAE